MLKKLFNWEALTGSFYLPSLLPLLLQLSPAIVFEIVI
jgi:hypothetical protein